MDDLAGALVGSWKVLEARLPNGQLAYTGTVTVARTGDVFGLEWDITAGRYVGIGLAIHSHLLVSCGEQRASLGIAHYQVQPGGEVSIRWSTPELKGQVGRGRFTSRLERTFEGQHAVTQSLPDGSLYGEWTLTIRRTGSVFEIAWHKGKTLHFTGLGFETQDGLAVGWYPDIRQLAFLDYEFDAHDRNRLRASWALGGFESLGTELIERTST